MVSDRALPHENLRREVYGKLLYHYLWHEIEAKKTHRTRALESETTMRTTARARTRCVLRCSTTFPATGRRVAQALGVVLAAAWPLGAAAAMGVFEDKATLSAAVSDWIANETTAEATHGAISGWDTSRVDDLVDLFRWTFKTWWTFKTTFNAQLNWDTSKVTDMYGTFEYAEAFNQPLAWDTSKVTSMQYTFSDAGAFNSELAWDTSSVTNMEGTFYSAEAFNAPLDWDTSKVTNMYGTFYRAEAFNQELVWDTSSVTNFEYFRKCDKLPCGCTQSNPTC